MKVDSKQEYYAELFRIQEQNAPSLAILVPKSEKIYDIDLDARTIEAPSEFSIVSSDHSSETIYFKLPRYYDNVDLSTLICIIQYTNAAGNSFIYPVPYYDVDTLALVDHDVIVRDGQTMTTEKPMMIIPWRVAGTAAAEPGKVTFAIQFYRFNGNSDMSYILNTLPQTLTIKAGLGVDQSAFKYTEESLVKQTYLEYFSDAAMAANEGKLYWEIYPFSD